MIDRASDLRSKDTEKAANETLRDDDDVLDARLDALRQALDSEQSMLAWVAPYAPDQAGGPERLERDLERLDARLARPKQVVRIAVGLLRPDELAVELMRILRPTRHARRDRQRAGLPDAPGRGGAATRPRVLLLDGAESILPATAEWLAQLHRLRDPSLQLVLVGRSEPLLRRVLSGALASVEIVGAERTAPLRASPIVPLFPQSEVPGSEDPVRLPVRVASVDIEGIEYELDAGRDEPWIVLDGMLDVPHAGASEGRSPGDTDESIAARSRARRDELPRRDWRPSPAKARASAIAEPAVPVVAIPEPIASPRRSERAPRRRRAAMLVLGLIALGLASWGSWLVSQGPPAREAHSRAERSPALPVPGAPPSEQASSGASERSAAPLERPSTSRSRDAAIRYDPHSRRLDLMVRGMSLSEVLTRIAWQTGLRVETQLALEQTVDVEISNLPLAETLERLLVDYLFLPLAATAPDESDPRTIWILGRRPSAPEIDGALDLLLHSSDPASNQDAARRLEELGRMAAGFWLHDLLLHAEALGEAESERLDAIRDRVRQTLCRAWGDRAVGPQASRLDCRGGLGPTDQP